jgi:hypothetical protein
MRTLIAAAAALIALVPAAAIADKLGDHPAVVVQRLQATQGYDYASKFYPHPAWLYLLPQQPREATQPAADFAKREPTRQELTLTPTAVQSQKR